MTLEFIKKRRLLVVLLITTCISFLLGVLFISILSTDNQELIKSSINSYFSGVLDKNVDYLKGFCSALSSNLAVSFVIWVMGISIIGILLVLGILMLKSFLVGFSFVSIIYTYGFKGLLIGLVYIIPEVISLFIIFLLSYYSISFSVLLFNYLFRKKEISRRVVVKRYLKLFVIVVSLMILLSLISVFVIPGILRMF